MSVDERLRSAFGADADDWRPVPPTADSLRARIRRRNRNLRMAVVGAAAAVTLAVGLVVNTIDHDRSPVPAPEPTPQLTSSPSDTATPHGLIATPLDGTWRAGPFEPAAVRQTLEAAGLAKFADPILAQLPRHKIVLDLRVSGRIWELTMRGQDSPTEVMDQEYVATVDAQQFTMGPLGEGNTGESTYSYDTAKRVLRLTFLATTEPLTYAVPGEAWQRALYTTSNFAKR